MGQRLPRAFDQTALEQPGPLSTGTGTLGGGGGGVPRGHVGLRPKAQ